jgi:hypothetical protein
MIDRLTAWFTGLGRTYDIRTRPYDQTAKSGEIVIAGG